MDILVFFKGLEILDIIVRAPIASMIDVVPSITVIRPYYAVWHP